MNRKSHRNPNPQGKGVVPVLADWEAVRPQVPSGQTPATLLLNWFVSALVLSAQFRFRPAVGGRYYLYLGAENWKLSLIGPGEWNRSAPGAFLGTCTLRPDMTWRIAPCAEGLRDEAIRERLAELARAFTASLDSVTAIGDLLPGYRRELPYYQCMLATALGSSLQQSAQQLQLLDAPGRLLLEDADGSLEHLV